MNIITHLHPKWLGCDHSTTDAERGGSGYHYNKEEASLILADSTETTSLFIALLLS